MPNVLEYMNGKVEENKQKQSISDLDAQQKRLNWGWALGPPNAPGMSSLATAKSGSIIFAFIPANDASVIGYSVYRSTKDLPSTGIRIRFIAQPSQVNDPIWVTDTPPTDETFFYWVASLNALGSESTRIGMGSASLPPGLTGFLAQGIQNYVISGGLSTAPASGLIMTIPAAVVFINGKQIDVPAQSHTYTASKYTQDEVKPDGTIVHTAYDSYTEIPSLPLFGGVHLQQVQTDATKIISVFDRRNLEPLLKELFASAFRWQKIVSELEITNTEGPGNSYPTGTAVKKFTGAYRYAPNNGILWYFSNLGLYFLIGHLEDTKILSYMDRYIANLANDYHSYDVFANPDATLDVNTTTGDPDPKRPPDSHDSQAATFIMLAVRYLRHTHDWAWLDKVNSRFNETNLATLKAIIFNNITTQIKTAAWCAARTPPLPVDFPSGRNTLLVSTFQNAFREEDSLTYDISFTADNSEVYRGLKDFGDLLKEIEAPNDNVAKAGMELDDSAWTKTGCTITANNTTAPNGSQSADKIVENLFGTEHSISQNPPTFTDNTLYRLTARVKPAERTWVHLQITRKDSGILDAFFNLTTGAVGNFSTGTTAKISADANGFYKCSIEGDVLTGATAASFRIALDNGSQTASYSGNGSSGLHVWGVELRKVTEADVTLQHAENIGIATHGLYDAIARKWVWNDQVKSGATGFVVWQDTNPDTFLVDAANVGTAQYPDIFGGVFPELWQVPSTSGIISDSLRYNDAWEFLNLASPNWFDRADYSSFPDTYYGWLAAVRRKDIIKATKTLSKYLKYYINISGPQAPIPGTGLSGATSGLGGLISEIGFALGIQDALIIAMGSQVENSSYPYSALTLKKLRAAQLVAQPFPIQTVTATTTIRPDSSFVRISAATATTNTATPSVEIIGVENGTDIIIANDGADYTLQDNSALVGSGLLLGASTLTIKTDQAVQFKFFAEANAWVRVGAAAVLTGGGSLINFQKQINNASTAQNWKIAELPATAAGTGDMIAIRAIGGDPASNAQFDYSIRMGRKGGFNAFFAVHGGSYPYSHARIRAYEEGSGKVSVYLSLLGTGDSHASVTVQQSEWGTGLTVFENPNDVGASPTGSLQFDSNTATPNEVRLIDEIRAYGATGGASDTTRAVMASRKLRFKQYSTSENPANPDGASTDFGSLDYTNGTYLDIIGRRVSATETTKGFIRLLDVVLAGLELHVNRGRDPSYRFSVSRDATKDAALLDGFTKIVSNAGKAFGLDADPADAGFSDATTPKAVINGAVYLNGTLKIITSLIVNNLTASKPLFTDAGKALTAGDIDLNASYFVNDVPIANGGTGSSTAAGARTNLDACQRGGAGAHTIALAKITPGGTDGSITWNGDGAITAFVDPT